VPKVLAKAGDSLADVYDVVGSIAGIEELITREVTTFHEMGQTIFSERLSGAITVFQTGALAQNTTWDLSFPTVAPASRILGLAVVSDVAARTLHCNFSLSDRGANPQDIPVWAWDSALDVQRLVRMQNLGGAAASLVQHQPVHQYQTPNLMVGRLQPQFVPTLFFRGLTSGFGAGTINLFGIAYLAFAELEGVASRGLPVPGW